MEHVQARNVAIVGGGPGCGDAEGTSQAVARVRCCYTWRHNELRVVMDCVIVLHYQSTTHIRCGNDDTCASR